MGRMRALDGLRGIAAFLVVVSHVIAAFFPVFYFGDAEKSFGGMVAASPLFVFWSGTFAVFVFFVLSGFVLSSSVSMKEFSFPAAVVRRYFRLGIPMVTAVILAWVLVSMFPDPSATSGDLNGNKWLADHYPGETPPLHSAIFGTMFTVFLTGKSWFNGVFWTMRHELIGSIAIYGLYRFLSRKQTILACSLVIPVMLWVPVSLAVLVGFPMGVLIYEGWKTGLFERVSRWWMILVAVGLFLGGQSYRGSDLYAFASVLFPHNEFDCVRSIGAAFLVCGVLSSQPLQRLLCTPAPQFLGRVSFSLYLIHLPVLLTWLCWGFIVSGGITPIFTLWVAAYFAACLFIAYVMTVNMDEPVVAVLRRLRRRGLPVPVPAS
jgi:peptidoglycan/LPS O-acetylase OafA/YrhL